MARKIIALLTLLAFGGAAGNDQCAADLFPALSNGKTGYINQQGVLTIPCQFVDGREFSEGLAAVLVDGKWGYVNEKAQIVIKPIFQDAGQFSDDRAWIQVNGKYGFINRQGTIVIKPKYRRATSFSEGYAVAEIDWRRDVLLDKAGKVKISPDLYRMMYEPTATLSAFSEGLLLAYPKGGRSPVYLDRDGQIAVRVPVEERRGTYTVATDFSDGLAAVRIGRNWGFIDRTGKIVIAPEYVKVGPFRQGATCVATEEIKNNVGHWTYFIIYSNGERIKQIPPLTIGAFSEGLISFSQRDKETGNRLYGYLNTRGEVVIQPQFDRAMPFRKGLARVRIHDSDAYIDKQGRPLWIGEPRSANRITSYSGRSMLDIYVEMLDQERWSIAQFYIQKMNRDELVEGSRRTLAWLNQDPKRTVSRDIGRDGVIGMVAVGPFFQTYCRTYAKAGKPIDPSPFRSMLIDKSLDTGFRTELARLFRHHSFYATSWAQLADDVAVLHNLTGDPLEDENLRTQAACTSFALIFQLYEICRRDTFKDIVVTGNTPTAKPDIVGMLGEAPGSFTPLEKARWELLVNSMDKAVAVALRLHQAARHEKTKKSLHGILKKVPDYHLLRKKELLTRIKEILTEEEKGSRNGP